MCHERSHWDWLGEFYQHEQLLRQQKEKLEMELRYMSNALHQASYTAQNERRILNQLQNELTEAQNLNKDHERGRVEEKQILEDERLEHRGTREALKFEQSQHAETTKYVEALYEAHQKSNSIIAGFVELPDDEQGFDPAGLILDNELKKQGIQELEDALRIKDQLYKLDISKLQEKSNEKDAEILKLTCVVNKHGDDDGILEDVSEASGRKRKRGGRRSRRGKTSGS